MEIRVEHEAAASPYADMTWQRYEEIVNRVMRPFAGRYTLRHLDYIHPIKLQRKVPQRFRTPYPVRVAYTAWGDASRPLLVCAGGVANSAQRFNYLAAALMDEFHVVCLDWVGRGMSGWMAAEPDYGLPTCVEQTWQLLQHLGSPPSLLLGSSMGGSVAIELAARHPDIVAKVILNDIGPYIPAARRMRRAQTLARHYVFRAPAERVRKTGEAQKNDGPVSDDVRLNGSYHQTRWSEEEAGRIYRHDIRALQSYLAEAGKSVLQWHKWHRIRCPVLVIHGMVSDALLPRTLAKMQKEPAVTVMHVPNTGHTPALADPHHIELIRAWLKGDPSLGTEFSAPYAPVLHVDERRAGARPII